jgi:hypothetical protein
MKQTYSIFTNDVGPDGYSCFAEFDAWDASKARRKAFKLTRGLSNIDRPVKVVVIRKSVIDLVFDPSTARSFGGLKLRPPYKTAVFTMAGKILR